MNFIKMSIQDLRDLTYEMYQRDEDITEIIKLIQERERKSAKIREYKRKAWE